jgi:hypothetical protein
MVPAFTLPTADPIPPPAPAPVALPAPSQTTPPSATSSARPLIPARVRLLLAVVAVVAVVLALALILIPPRSDAPVAVASKSASSPTSAASTHAVAPTQIGPISLSGTGSQDVEFAIPEDSPGLATINNNGQGAFLVWTVGADGARNEQLVSVVGPFAGTRLFDYDRHSTGFSIESDGAWSIEINPVPSARTWDLSERLVGDGSDVILVFPPTSAEASTTVRYDGEGDFVVWVYGPSGKVQLLNETGPLEASLLLPLGTSLIEVLADAAWSIAPD